MRYEKLYVKRRMHRRQATKLKVISKRSGNVAGGVQLAIEYRRFNSFRSSERIDLDYEEVGELCGVLMKWLIDNKKEGADECACNSISKALN